MPSLRNVLRPQHLEVLQIVFWQLIYIRQHGLPSAPLFPLLGRQQQACGCAYGNESGNG